MARAHNERIRARRCVVQALYQWLLAGQPPSDIVNEFIADRELINVDRDYFCSLTTAVAENYQALVNDIQPSLDRQWEQIDPVEKCVLLIGTHELKHELDIPWKVVVNEAVGLCKMFGSEQAHRYINGVLDKIAKSARQESPVGLATGS